MAKQLNAKRIIASGATPWEKQDLKDDYFLYQHKETSLEGHRIELKELKQLRLDAIDEYRRPIYVIDYKKDNKRYFLIDEDTYNELKEFLENEHNTATGRNPVDV